VMLVCPFTSKPTRVWFVTIADKSWSKKYRFSKVALKAKGGEAKDYIIK
jgi:large subunit ribosomal protein L24